MQKHFFAWINRTFPLFLLIPLPIIALQLAVYLLWKPYRLSTELQPFFGYYLDYYTFTNFLNSCPLALFVLPLSFWFSKNYLNKVTRQYLSKEQFSDKFFYWAWGLFASGCMVFFSPNLIQTTVQLASFSLKENDARQKATALFQFVTEYKIQEILDQLPPTETPNKDRAVLFTDRLKSMAGENLHLDSVKLVHVSGPKKPPVEGLPAQTGIVVFDAYITGTRGKILARTSLEDKQGTWVASLFTFADIQHDMKNRFFEPLGEKVAYDYVRLVVDGFYRQAWERVPASLKKGTDSAALERLSRTALDELERPVEIEFTEVSTLYSPNPSRHFLWIQGRLKAKNKTVPLNLTVYLDPATHMWQPSGASFH